MQSAIAEITATSEFWSAIAGALVGSLTGGIMAYFVQMGGLVQARKQRAKDKLDVQQSLAYSLLFKIIRIHSDLHQLNTHFKDAFEKAKTRDEGEEPWQYVLPLANFPAYVHFTAEEVALVLSLGDDDVLNMVLSLDTVHNSAIDVVQVISNERRSLTEQLRPSTVISTRVGGEFSRDEMLLLRPRMIEVNSLIERASANLANDFAGADTALKALDKLLREKLGLGHKVEAKASV